MSSPFSIHSRNRDQDCTLDALQAAIILRGGLQLDHPAFSRGVDYLPGWLTSANRSFADISRDDRFARAAEFGYKYRNLPLYEICRAALRLAGNHLHSSYDREEIVRSAVSTAELTNIFTTNVGAQLLASYESSPDTSPGWTREAEVRNFQTQERTRLTKGPSLEKLPRGDSAKHLEAGDVKEEYKIARYARQFSIDEQDIIDDYFDALLTMPQEMGEAARQLRPDLVYAILLANGNLSDGVALFHTASHGNLQTTAALSSATLKTAVTNMGTQTENGRNLLIRPKYLLVPYGLKHTASELINSSQVVVAGATDTERGSRNSVMDDNLSLISDSRLDNGVTDPATGTAHAGSADTWYLAADRAPTIEVGYRQGTGRAPTLRGYQLDRGQWGLGWDVNMDIGAKALDYRGLSKNTA